MEDSQPAGLPLVPYPGQREVLLILPAFRWEPCALSISMQYIVCGCLLAQPAGLLLVA
jgi:hypothetical protein